MSRPALLLVLLMPLLACATSDSGAETPAPGEPNPMLVEVGGRAFATHCASCHGTDGRGAGPVAAALRTPPADLTRTSRAPRRIPPKLPRIKS